MAPAHTAAPPSLDATIRSARRARRLRIALVVLSLPFAMAALFMGAALVFPGAPSPGAAVEDPLSAREPLRGAPPGMHEYGASMDIPAALPPAAFPAPAAIRQMAAAWVDAINRYNPDAILHHQVDPHGTLYLVPGGWVYVAEGISLPDVVENLAFSWHAYLFDVIGEWWDPASSAYRFEPGVVLLDCEGEIIRTLDGSTTYTRPHLSDRCYAAPNPPR
jgi:hypothetical protein